MSGYISEKNNLTAPAGLQSRLLPTDAVRGFSGIATCEGRPTGVPADVPGQVPMVVDITNKELYIYVGAWIAMSQDFYTEVQKGNIPGHSTVHKYGKNPTVPNGAFQGVLQAAAQFYFASAATTVRVKAGGSSLDVSGGSNAQGVVIDGLDAEGLRIQETLVLDGATASAVSTNLYWRVFRTWVSSVGKYGGSNDDQIIIEDGAGGNDRISIEAGEGQSQYACFSIPSNQTGYLNSVQTYVDAAKAANFILYTREQLNDVTAPMEAKRLRLSFDGMLGSNDHEDKAPNLRLPPWTDIWFEAEGGGAQTSVSVDFELLLVDNDG